MRPTIKLSAPLAALTIAVMSAAPAAYARPIVDSASSIVTCDPSAVPPPPSSIAVSAAKEYAILRACAQDHRPTDASAPGDARQQFGSPDARDAADSRLDELTGFDWSSAALGAAAGTALVILALALATGGRRTSRRTT